MSDIASINPKKLVGEAVALWVTDGMRLGLGTGSTTAYAIESIGKRIQAEGLNVVGTPTSFAAERLARQYGIPLVTLDEVTALDLAIDGADEVDPVLNLIKGRGAAHTREKIVAQLAKKFIILVDDSKLVPKLGTKMPLPVEVLPMAISPVMRRIEALGGKPVLRMGKMKDGPVVSDQGFWIVDVHFEQGIADTESLNTTLLKMEGVLDHGLFLNMATQIMIGNEDGTISVMNRHADS